MTPEERSLAALELAFKDVMSSTSGKRVLFWLLEQVQIYKDPFAMDATERFDGAKTSYGLGRQSAGRMLLAQVDAVDPTFYPRLLLEMADLRLADQAATKTQPETNDDDQIA